MLSFGSGQDGQGGGCSVSTIVIFDFREKPNILYFGSLFVEWIFRNMKYSTKQYTIMDRNCISKLTLIRENNRVFEPFEYVEHAFNSEFNCFYFLLFFYFVRNEVRLT